MRPAIWPNIVGDKTRPKAKSEKPISSGRQFDDQLQKNSCCWRRDRGGIRLRPGERRRSVTFIYRPSGWQAIQGGRRGPSTKIETNPAQAYIDRVSGAEQLVAAGPGTTSITTDTSHAFIDRVAGERWARTPGATSRIRQFDSDDEVVSPSADGSIRLVAPDREILVPKKEEKWRRRAIGTIRPHRTPPGLGSLEVSRSGAF